MILNLLILTFAIVYIIDYSGIVFELSKTLYHRLNQGKPYMGQLIPKPFSCSVCVTFWTTLIYSMFTDNIIHSLGLACGFAILSTLIYKLIGIIMKLINKL